MQRGERETAQLVTIHSWCQILIFTLCLNIAVKALQPLYIIYCFVTRQQFLKHPPEDYAATFDEACHHSNDHVSQSGHYNIIITKTFIIKVNEKFLRIKKGE